MKKVGLLRDPEPHETPGQPLAGHQQDSFKQQQQRQQQQRHPGRLIEVLGRINSKMEINADVRLGRMNLVVTDGLLLVPEEIR